MTLHVVGVRHHSPACARLVAHVIDRVRPKHVLVEGPCDMNDRLAELALPHRLPVAIFSYLHRDGHAHASYSPFCAYSPEWVALERGRAVGAEVRFNDLPAWHDAFHGVENRYSDRHLHYSERIDALCRRIGVEDSDALWDHLFEQPAPPDVLAERLRVYFEELRGDDPGDEENAPREALMSRFIAAAMHDGGDVVVVCGGYHAPALVRAAERWRDHSPEWPTVPATTDRVGSFLVPYSFKRLDSFTGYQSGMPSPAYQQEVWESGPDRAGERMLQAATVRLRRKKQPASSADLLAALAQAQGLQRLRGHEALGRTDVLDGLASALLKDALDAPLPWTRRGTLAPGTDPLLVEIVAAFSGEVVGRLAPGTPRPPLVHDARAELEALGLSPGRIELDLSRELHRSRTLHRLRVLGIPGYRRDSGPEWATEGELRETWTITDDPDAEGSLIQAAVYGATLESAAAGRLEERLLGADGRLDVLAALLGEAVFVGIGSLAQRLASALQQGVGHEPAFDVLGAALARLLALWRHDRLLGSAGAPMLGSVISAAFDRGLWLVEGLLGETAPAQQGHVNAVVALRDTLRFAGGPLSLPTSAAHSVMSRRCHDLTAPPAIRGGAQGFLWSTGHYADAGAAELDARHAMLSAARPETLGDFLVGLFAVAREEVLASAGLLGALDGVLGALGEQDFLIALPSLRLACGFFPPREKDALARAILAMHGRAEADVRSLVKLDVDARTAAAGLLLDEAVTKLARRYGLEVP